MHTTRYTRVEPPCQHARTVANPMLFPAHPIHLPFADTQRPADTFVDEASPIHTARYTRVG